MSSQAIFLDSTLTSSSASNRPQINRLVVDCRWKCYFLTIIARHIHPITAVSTRSSRPLEDSTIKDIIQLLHVFKTRPNGHLADNTVRFQSANMNLINYYGTSIRKQDKQGCQTDRQTDERCYRHSTELINFKSTKYVCFRRDTENFVFSDTFCHLDRNQHHHR